MELNPACNPRFGGERKPSAHQPALSQRHEEHVAHLYLFQSDPHVHALVTVCDRTTDGNGCTSIVTIAFHYQALVMLVWGWMWEGGWRLFRRNAHHCFTFLYVHIKGIHIGKSELRFICHVIYAWVSIGLHPHHNYSCANGHEVTTFIVSEGTDVHLAVLNANCVLFSLEKSDSTHCSPLPVNDDEQRHRNISFEGAVFSWLPIVINKGGPVENQEEDTYKGERNF